MLGRDGWAGLAVLAACLVLFALTLGLKGNPMVPIGPGFYPRIVLGVTAVFAALLVFSDWRARRLASPAAPVAGPRRNMVLVGANFAVFGCYVAALPAFGFRLSTFAYVFAAQVLLDPSWRPRHLAAQLVLALATAALSWFAFERYLSVLLPRGAWSGF
ncbi:MAG TPA: tripartite tricarboxylate transporter TctB family protein [Burkholderiales bacterium]